MPGFEEEFYLGPTSMDPSSTERDSRNKVLSILAVTAAFFIGSAIVNSAPTPIDKVPVNTGPTDQELGELYGG